MREYTVLEAGLEPFVHLDKGDFVGRDALLKQMEVGVPQEFVTLEVQDSQDADPPGNAPIWQGDNMLGRATAGAYGHSVGKSLAIGYVQTGIGAVGAELELEILGKRCPAAVIAESPHDPGNLRLKV